MLEEATWHLYSLEPAAQSSQWLQLSEAQFRQASFLDQRLLANESVANQPFAVALEPLQTLIGCQPEPLANFIFHIGHCGSTLLSRALAASPSVLPIREPLSLRELAACQTLVRDDHWSLMLNLALAAHSRVFAPDQVSMIKATSTCNGMILPIMERSPLARSVLLYLPLESYLAGMLGKQTPALDLRGHAAARQQEWRYLTHQPIPLASDSEPSEVQLAVLSWLTCMTRLLQAQEQLPSRCLLLDFESFLAGPELALDNLIGFFGLTASREDILQAWPDISVGYSKQPDQPYSSFNRSRTLARGRTQRGEDISTGLAWARQLLPQYPVLQACAAFIDSN